MRPLVMVSCACACVCVCVCFTDHLPDTHSFQQRGKGRLSLGETALLHMNTWSGVNK